jgi:hypothetical protein
MYVQKKSKWGIIVLLCVIVLFVALYSSSVNESLVIPPTNVESLVNESLQTISGNAGIVRICLPNDPSNKPCFDISLNANYTDSDGYTYPASSTVKAQIAQNYYISSTGVVQPVPYGYTVANDMKTLTPTSITAIYADQFNRSAVYSSKNTLDENTKYNTDNYNMQYHNSPQDVAQPDSNFGIVMARDKNGNMVFLTDAVSMAPPIYYEPGSYLYGPKSYVPNYEDAILLSQYSK